MDNEISFIRQVTFDHALQIQKLLEDRKIPYGLFVSGVYFEDLGAEVFIHYGDCDEPDHNDYCDCYEYDNWFGTIDNVIKSRNSRLLSLKKPH